MHVFINLYCTYIHSLSASTSNPSIKQPKIRAIYSGASSWSLSYISIGRVYSGESDGATQIRYALLYNGGGSLPLCAVLCYDLVYRACLYSALCGFVYSVSYSAKFIHCSDSSQSSVKLDGVLWEDLCDYFVGERLCVGIALGGVFIQMDVNKIVISYIPLLYLVYYTYIRGVECIWIFYKTLLTPCKISRILLLERNRRSRYNPIIETQKEILAR